MTGDEELTARLAAALPEALGPVGLRTRAVPELEIVSEPTGYGDVLLAALLPVVRRYGDQRAAETWDSAADELELSGLPPTHWAVVGFRARAAALRGAGE